MDANPTKSATSASDKNGEQEELIDDSTLLMIAKVPNGTPPEKMQARKLW